MRCPYCQALDSRVVESRSSDDGDAIRRRRECVECHRRFTTYERVEERPLLIIKKGGNREQFNRAKIIAGLMKACEKRPVTMDQIEDMAGQIERELRDEYDREVTSQAVGEKVMSRLRVTDEVAYVRFASVYRQFADLDGFIKTINQLRLEMRSEGERC
ncbi:MAG: transcriptional regulator NrdR [Syntrophomonadaceae bacterium]|jgi:transcriptional repressor NrdR|nr:transcriptional regulator NrdR [Syntrophomonadaceae bacterium]